MTISELRFAIKLAKKNLLGSTKDGEKCKELIKQIPEIMEDIKLQKEKAEEYIQSNTAEKPIFYYYHSPSDIKLVNFYYQKKEYDFIGKGQKAYKHETNTVLVQRKQEFRVV